MHEHGHGAHRFQTAFAGPPTSVHTLHNDKRYDYGFLCTDIYPLELFLNRIKVQGWVFFVICHYSLLSDVNPSLS